MHNSCAYQKVGEIPGAVMGGKGLKIQTMWLGVLLHLPNLARQGQEEREGGWSKTAIST